MSRSTTKKKNQDASLHQHDMNKIINVVLSLSVPLFKISIFNS